MNLLPWVLALVSMAVAAVMWLTGSGARARVSELEKAMSKATQDAKNQQESQAQVIHTTKLASLGQMVAGVAHEINTPLGFIKSNIDVVSEMLTEYENGVTKLMTGLDLMNTADANNFEQVKPFLVKAKNELSSLTSLAEARDLIVDSMDGIGQISNLVLNLKNFSRVDRDGMDLVDLNECVRSSLAIGAHQYRDRIQVFTNFAALPKVKAMPAQINQVLLNLITNACQAMGESGILNVTTRATGELVEVEVKDDGPGIPENVLPKIFDPFFTTKAVGEGTGLGLSIVHKIVQGHGGTIRVKSVKGEGTMFTVSLPLPQNAGVSSTPKKSAKA